MARPRKSAAPANESQPVQDEAPKKKRGGQPGNKNAKLRAEQANTAPKITEPAIGKPTKKHIAKPIKAKPEATEAPKADNKPKRKYTKKLKPQVDQAAQDEPKKTGRPSVYSESLADAICDRLIEGESMRSICASEDMPDRKTVLRWQDTRPDFAAKCARAREAQADFMDDLILDTARACTAESATADRVRIGAYQWRAARLQPKKYGDKLMTEHTGANGGSIQHDITMSVNRFEEIARQVADEI